MRLLSFAPFKGIVWWCKRLLDQDSEGFGPNLGFSIINGLVNQGILINLLSHFSDLKSKDK